MEKREKLKVWKGCVITTHRYQLSMNKERQDELDSIIPVGFLHDRELVTVDIYGDNSNIIPEEIPELLAYMKDVMPPEGRQEGSGPNVLDTVIDTEMYLPEKWD